MIIYLLGLLSGIILTPFYLIYRFKKKFININTRIDTVEQEMYDVFDSIYSMVEKIADDADINKDNIKEIDGVLVTIVRNQKMLSDLTLGENEIDLDHRFKKKEIKPSIDNVLDKINKEGLENLTDEERDILNNM